MPVVAGLVVVVLERVKTVADVVVAGVEVGAPATCPAFGWHAVFGALLGVFCASFGEHCDVWMGDGMDN
jgi:hypothetical protein